MSTGCFPASSEMFRVENVKLLEFESFKEKKISIRSVTKKSPGCGDT